MRNDCVRYMYLQLQTVKTQIKRRIKWHFIRVYTVCFDKIDRKRKKIQFYLEIVTYNPLNYTMDHSKFIASTQKEEFISALRFFLWQSLELHVIICSSKSCQFRADRSLSESNLQQILQISC